MALGIRLLRKTVDIPVDSVRTSRRMTIEVVQACGLSRNIFVYRGQTVDPLISLDRSSFRNVATPKDLDELPVNAATDGLFRKKIIDVITRSPETQETIFEAVKKDVEELIGALEQLEIFEQPDSVDIGEEEPVSSSSSS